jgi:hypothetical protein
MAKLEPTNVFCVAFDTQKLKGYIEAVKVTIETDVMDAMDSARVDLCDHPLDPQLERYVLENPSAPPGSVRPKPIPGMRK